MPLSFRLIIIFYCLGALLLNSCHEVSPEKVNQPIAERIDGLHLYSEGPNCWNGALIKTGIAQSVRFVPKGEYWFWMKSPYCRGLKKDEVPKKGDLGSIFWTGYGHYHSFVFLDKTWVFSKNSPDPKYPYKVQRFEEMFFEEQRPKAKRCWLDSKSRANKSAANGLSCDFEVVYHRCKPIEDKFFQVDANMALLDSRVKPLENEVFLWTAGDSQLSLVEYEKTINRLYGILREVQDLNKEHLSKRKKFVMEAMEFRILGLILADIRVATMIPKLYPVIQYAYASQNQKKMHVPMN